MFPTKVQISSSTCLKLVVRFKKWKQGLHLSLRERQMLIHSLKVTRRFPTLVPSMIVWNTRINQRHTSCWFNHKLIMNNLFNHIYKVGRCTAERASLKVCLSEALIKSKNVSNKVSTATVVTGASSMLIGVWRAILVGRIPATTYLWDKIWPRIGNTDMSIWGWIIEVRTVAPSTISCMPIPRK